MTFRPTYKRLGPSSQNTILFGTLANGSSRLIPPLGETCADGGFVPKADFYAIWRSFRFRARRPKPSMTGVAAKRTFRPTPNLAFGPGRRSLCYETSFFCPLCGPPQTGG
jgi:hypothetical protein